MAHFTVIGLGRFGITVSLELIHLGHTVTGIDSSKKLAEQYADQLTQTVICDAADEKALQELDLSSSQAVLVAIGENMEASLLCTLHLKKFGIKNLWVKANTSPHHKILTKLGVDRIVHPEEEMGVRIAQVLSYPMISDYLELGHGYYVVELHVAEKYSGSTLERFVGSKSAASVKPMLLKRGQEIISPIPPGCELQARDIILLCGTRTALRQLGTKLV